MTSLKRTLLSALLLATSGCGDLLFLEVEQPEVCKTLPEQVFAGSQTSMTLTVNIGQELQGLGFDSPEGIEPFVSLKRARLVARQGIDNFDFLDSVRIRLLPPEGSSQAPLTAVDYTRTGPTGSTLELPGSEELDVSGYISQETVRLEASFSGRMPPEQWSMDMQVCLYGRARVDYLDVAKQ